MTRKSFWAICPVVLAALLFAPTAARSQEPGWFEWLAALLPFSPEPAPKPAPLPGARWGTVTVADGDICVFDLSKEASHQLTHSGGYRYPVFGGGRTAVYALRDSEVVRIRGRNREPELIGAIRDVVALLGPSKENDSDLIFLAQHSDRRWSVGTFSLDEGRVSDFRRVQLESGRDSSILDRCLSGRQDYGDVSLFVVFGKIMANWRRRGMGPNTIPSCDEDRPCGQPSMSSDRRYVVFVMGEP